MAAAAPLPRANSRSSVVDAEYEQKRWIPKSSSRSAFSEDSKSRSGSGQSAPASAAVAAAAAATAAAVISGDTSGKVLRVVRRVKSLNDGHSKKPYEGALRRDLSELGFPDGEWAGYNVLVLVEEPPVKKNELVLGKNSRSVDAEVYLVYTWTARSKTLTRRCALSRSQLDWRAQVLYHDAERAAAAALLAKIDSCSDADIELLQQQMALKRELCIVVPFDPHTFLNVSVE